MDVQLAAHAVGELAHLAPVGAGIALCGIVGMKVARKYFWIGQVGCDECRKEYARKLGKQPERRRK